MGTLRIALIAHDFPPYNVGGSQRPYLMAKALADVGIAVTIFTLNTEFYDSSRLNYEFDFNQYDNINVIRTKIKERSRTYNGSHYFKLTDDIASRWEPYLYKAIYKTHQEAGYDYILFTCPPFSMASKANKLSGKLKIPYILDFRDAWSQWIISPYASYLHYKILLQIEKKAIEKAVFVTSTSNQQIEDFVKIHGRKFKNKFVYAPNGFKNYEQNTVPNTSGNKIRIVYTGSFYFNPYSQDLQKKKWYQKKIYQWLQYLPRTEDWTYRSPLFFFKSLQKFLLENQQFSEQIEVIFAGQKPDWFDQMVNEHHLQKVVKHLGFIDKKGVENLLIEANYLLITSSKIPEGKEYSVAGKTFEYISYQKPILAFVSEGEQKTVLNKTGLAHIFNPDNVEENVFKLRSVLKGNESLKINKLACDQYKIPNNYANLLSKIKNL